MADTIRRTKRTGNFTTVRNEYLQDVNLSWKAKGLITYIMSLPPAVITILLLISFVGVSWFAPC